MHILALIRSLWVMSVIHLEQCLAYGKSCTKVSGYYLIVQRPLSLPFFSAIVEVTKSEFSVCDVSGVPFKASLILQVT